ncbi:NupC/NupG family nucleoside CNT transporter [Mammaliicoccus stepanovicii]|uniref:Putative sodium dependent nucleoside transporter n=1 Tax=Mammaliicoccus stepanovicii TaxID=643214 RepID=A0A240A374_9STAP|nr:nucleoside transporter C-terminal domain-containing protein [Mammaliicoccus stepanovicii]PNZ71932.1 NupC/NupG family nucleoside CNT transporter [Mammaliicoccus stepanovicii]GGI39421.1 nucleoside permease [Mammaliicoccus stepanovicii]SNV77815.1 putative sodium dependent nucleoside transporter [Mammaliicoccus stepanovicii]
MFLIINIIGLLIFIGVAFLFSRDKKNIDWKSVIILIAINLVLAWFFTQFPIGAKFIKGAADGVSWLIESAFSGIGFAFGSFTAPGPGKMDMAVSALLPILLVVPVFDILMYVGILPKFISALGWVISKVTRQPKFESFFSIEMMFLGNTEALAVSSKQLTSMNKVRVLTVAMMSMSSVSGAIVGAYVTMIPGEYVLMAIPLNIINAIIVTTILNPFDLDPADDEVAEIETGERQPFFSFLGDSVINAGKLVLIIIAFVIAFVALADLINKLLGIMDPIPYLPEIRLEYILGIFMFPFALLLGLPVGEAWVVAQQMALKIVTNEFVVMSTISKEISGYSTHRAAVISTFLVSFANFSTVGMIIGTLKGIVKDDVSNFVSKYVPMMLLSGILVSLLTAAFVGLFAW